MDVGRSEDEALQGSPGEPGATEHHAASAQSGSGVKKHHHKHNLKHRYELLETLGRGTYGKVKKAIERHSGRVEQFSFKSHNLLSTTAIPLLKDIGAQGLKVSHLCHEGYHFKYLSSKTSLLVCFKP